jgi:hypothetical protein
MAEYRKTLVTYIDILGFRQLIKQSERDPTKVDEILNILKITKEKGQDGPISHVGSDTLDIAITSQNFSDLIIRKVNRAPDPQGFLMLMELILLSRIQCTLLTAHGVLIRGGICENHLYMEDGFVFGPALVRSYELAEQKAVFPRIMVDAAMVEATNYAFPGLMNKFMLKIRDEVFIDYLYASFTTLGVMHLKADEQKLAMLEAHKKVIERKLVELAADARAYDKIDWLACYHNSVIIRLVRDFPNLETSLKPLVVSLK